ncbi:TonB-dependent receptor [Proteiniphilum sp.]|uniref:TonB-dependent receptor n=1 Tax=Proteiniphilum sp. TaxID=1926877 RepID=UPI002B1EF6DC|nr:TonB-dependent receptor [Proteiniphilum sp.]MEA4917334.1 TonB-dependent receptor [Proteiniphilum sp.]
MKKLTTLFLMLLCLSVYPILAQRYTISGYITDKENGETLLSATIYDSNSSKGSVTNNFGYYSLTLPAGTVTLEYSYIGYRTLKQEFQLKSDTVLNIQLAQDNMLQEVTVIGHRSEIGVKGTQMSTVEVPIEQIKNIPTLLGENDLIKALQLLPGVQSGTEGSAGLYVRGGGPDENLLLLDGVPLYNVNHMLGFFSVFNSDALKNVTLYKGSFPARFGGRLSSIVDVRMKDGDDKKIRGTASIGLISSKLQLEGPIIKEKTTFNISLRRTYLDVLAQPIIKMMQDEGNGGVKSAGYYFYDINAKFTHKLSDRDKLYLSTYMGDDAIYMDVAEKSTYGESFQSKEHTKLDWNWGNTIAALRWNRVVNNKLFMNTTASFTRYRSALGSAYESQDFSGQGKVTREEETRLSYNSGIRDWTLKTDFDFTPNVNHDVKFGASYTYHTFSPDVTSLKFNSTGDNNEENIDTIAGSPKVYAHETMAFLEDNFSLGRVLKINLGAHFSSFHVQNSHYFSLQPRAGLRVLLAENLSLKAGYASMNQYIHMLSNNSISMPTDLWVPATTKIKPMKSHQYALGAFYSVPHIADFSVEGYYKTMHNLLEYKDGASFIGSSTNWEEKVSMGRGVAYGIEFLAQRSFGNTTGWIGYTWSKSDRLFDRPGNTINKGRWFPAKYDRRHDISITGTHKFSEKIDVSASWVFSTGNAATFAFHEYAAINSPNYRGDSYYFPDTYYHVDARNNFRYDNYHRLDFGVNFHKITKRGNLRTWNISIYNVYNRLNPFYLYIWGKTIVNPETGERKTKSVLRQTTLFPIIPSVSYTIKF